MKIDLATVKFSPELLKQIPAATARLYRVLPILKMPTCLGIVVANARDLNVIDELHFVLGCELQVDEAEERQLEEYIQRLYGNADG